MGCPLYVDVACLNHVELRSHIGLTALGKALASAKRPLVYGGGSKGIMGIVSSAVLGAGGDVVGVIPYAILAAGGEGPQINGDGPPSISVKMEEDGRVRVSVVRFCGNSLLNRLIGRTGMDGCRDDG